MPLPPRPPVKRKPTPSLAEFRVQRHQYTEECPDCGQVVGALLSPDCDPVLDVDRADAKRIRCELTAKAIEYGNFGMPYNAGVEGLSQHATKCPGTLMGRSAPPTLPVPVAIPRPPVEPGPEALVGPQPEQPAEQPAQPPADRTGTGG